MTHGFHIVGSIAQPDLRSAIQWQLAMFGNRLHAVSGGETGERSVWLTYIVHHMREHPDLEVKQEGNFDDYHDLLMFRVRDGHTFDGTTIDMDYFNRVRAELAELDRQAPGERRDLLVGMPDFLNLSLFLFGAPSVRRLRTSLASGHGFRRELADTPDMLRYARQVRRGVNHEIADVSLAVGSRAIIQLEVVLQQIAVTQAPRPVKKPLARVLAKMVVAQVAHAPEGTRFGIHQCFGDLSRSAMTTANDMESVVILANAIAAEWPAGRSLEFIHAPVAGGMEPPPTDREYYSALNDLRIPSETRFAVGLIHEDYDVADQVRVLGLVEHELPIAAHRIDVSTYCGLGRRTQAKADEAGQRMIEVVHEHER